MPVAFHCSVDRPWLVACARFVRVDAGLGDISLRCSARFAELILLAICFVGVFSKIVSKGSILERDSLPGILFLQKTWVVIY